jgi:purine-cytosine permease-like protein
MAAGRQVIEGERLGWMNFENIITSILVFFLMWLIAAAMYTRLAPKSTLLKQTVGL